MADTILLPDPIVKYELNTGNFVPVGVVENLGFDSLRNTAVKMEGVKDGKLFYISSRLVNLDSNQSTQVVFDNNLVFSQLGDVELRLITLHLNDQNKTNDTFIQKYFVQVSNDVAVDSILSPTASSRIPSLSEIKPKVTLSNQGIASQSSGFDVNCRIQNPTGIIIYDETENFTLDSGETKTVEFSKTLQLVDTGDYTILVRSQLGTDQFLPNDTKTHGFHVYYSSNNELETIFPEANKRYIPHQFSDTIHPRIRITKTGEDNVADTGKVYLSISAVNSSYTYFDSLDFILPTNTNPDTTLVFGNTFNSNIKDSFNTNAWLVSKHDGFRPDDSLAFGFSVLFATDISLIEDLFYIGPNPTKGDLTIKAKGSDQIKTLVLIDNAGKKVMEQQFKSERATTQLNIGHLPDGIYFLLLNDFRIKISKVGNP